MKCFFAHSRPTSEDPPESFIQITGTGSSHYEMEEGYVSLQQWQVEDYTLVFVQADIHKNLAFEIKQQGYSEILAISLNGRCELSVFPDSVTMVPRDHFHFYHKPNFQAFAKLLTVKKITSLLLIHHPAAINTKDVEDNTDFSPTLMPIEMVEKLERILYASYAIKKHFHLEELETLFQLAHEAKKRLIGAVHFNELDIEKLHEVKNWLDRNLDKVYSVATLTSLAAITTKKMNRGFLNLFGKTPYTYFREKKLLAAHTRIIETNTPIKLIGKQSGYNTTSNFSVAFKNQFGYSPASLRKKSR